MKHKPVVRRRFSTSWAKLPLPALVEIMKYLSDSERVSCAQVCRHWENAFDSPILWRRGDFEFGGSRFRPLGKKAVSYATKVGRHLRHLTITCRQLTSHTCETMIQYLEAFLTSLTSMRRPPVLHTLEIEGLELQFWRYGYLRDQVASCLIEFLRTQKVLKVFHMPNAQFAQQCGVDVLEAIADRNGSQLETMLFEFFFHSQLAVWQMDRFQTVMKNFTNLHTVAINYCCLSEELILSWAETLKGKLESLRIRSFDNEPYGNVISNDAWSQLVASCPRLQVDFYIFGFGNARDVIPLLAPRIPLTAFNFFTGYDTGMELRLNAILNHVTSCYPLSLCSLDVEFDNYHDDVDDALVRLVTRCRNLTSLRVKAQMGLEVARYVCRMLEEGRASLTRVDLMLSDVSGLELDQLRELREDMVQVVNSRHIELALHDDEFSP